MEYKLYEFLPLYNQVQTETFNNDVNSLEEFTSLKLPIEEEVPQHPGDLLLHQRLIANFINPHTPYNGLLLVHEMGTGKTCSAVAVAERFIRTSQSEQRQFPETRLKNIIVLTKGKGLQNNFINEIANVCTKGQYLEGIDYVKNRDRRVRKNIKVNYTFDTFEVFSKNLRKLQDREKTNTYENTLFIVDEAHHLRMSNDPEERNIYKEIFSLFELLKHRKILLLTGTPMKDQPEEIVNLMNLIIPNKLESADLTNLENLKTKVSGYVSYLRAMMSDIDRTEEGVHLGTLQHFKVIPVVMEEFQSRAYLEAKQRDDVERSIFNNSRQASSFVFPDNTFGKIGFETNVVATTSGYRFASSAMRDEVMANLQRYSAKYFDVINKLEDDYKANRLSFVFSEFVKGSGLIILSILLELKGYSQAKKNSNFAVQKKRFALFTTETSTDAQIKYLISMYNNPKNLKGEYISTILGSKVIMEGFSFKNVQSEYILTPHWNYSETSQIIARGLRVGSHNDLVNSGFVPNIKIYQYVALPHNTDDSTPSSTTTVARSVVSPPHEGAERPSHDSIDLYMYEISEKKDFEIQTVIRTLKEAAFDCQLNKDRNTVLNENLANTRSCEYTRCNFQCDNNTPLSNKNDRNYKLLYFKLSDGYLKLKNKIVEMVSGFPVTVDDITTQTNNSEFEVVCVLEDLLNFRQALFTRPDGVYYLSMNQNLFFASTINTLDTNNDPFLLNYYNHFVPVFMGKSIDELLYVNQQNFMTDLVNKIFSSKKLTDLQQHLVKLPVYLQEKLLCYSISLKDVDTPNNFARDMILNNFKLYYEIVDDENPPTAFVWLHTAYKCNLDYRDVDGWKDCDSAQKRQIDDLKVNRANIKMTNPYSYIGLLNRTTNDFCLRKVDQGDITDKRRKNVGKRCQNWKKPELVDLAANRLKLSPVEMPVFGKEDVKRMKQDPKLKDILQAAGTMKDYRRVAFWNSQDITYLCTKIKQKLMDEKLVLDDPNCGTARKTR